MYVAIQSNGERLLFEDWVVRAYYAHELTDEFLLRPLRSAVVIEDWFNRQMRCLLSLLKDSNNGN